MQIRVWSLKTHNSRRTFLNLIISQNKKKVSSNVVPLLKGARFQNTCKNDQKWPVSKDIKMDKKAKK